jgi:hypothetical protein
MLTHEQQHRDIVGVAGRNTREGIRRSWTGASHGDSDCPSGAGIAVGDLYTQPFMASGKDLD